MSGWLVMNRGSGWFDTPERNLNILRAKIHGRVQVSVKLTIRTWSAKRGDGSCIEDGDARIVPIKSLEANIQNNDRGLHTMRMCVPVHTDLI